MSIAEDLGGDEHLVEPAIDACHRGLLVNGRHKGLLKKTAELLEQEERWDEAADFWGTSRNCRHHRPTLHIKMGIAWQHHGDAGSAREQFDKALALEPENEAATFAMVQLLDELGEPEEIIQRLERLAKAKPESARVALALANYLRKYGRLAEAIDWWRSGLAREPNWDDSWRDLGLGLEHLHRINEAVEAYRHAVEAVPDNSENHRYLASALQDAGQLDSALESFNRATELNTDNADAHWGRFWVRALRGEFPEAWDDYEWRWKLSNRNTPQLDDSTPLWDGNDLSGQTIFLRAEQGYGDTIQAIRYAPRLVEMGATVKVGCPPALARLLADAPGVSEVATGNAGMVTYHCHQAMFSLPRLLGTTLDSIPGPAPYLKSQSQAGLELPQT